MANSSKDRGGERSEQVSVRLGPELRAAIERQAQSEHRTLSGQIRHLVAQAFQNQEQAAP